jgi:hypothetical protein
MNLKRLILFSIFVALIAFAGVSYWELTKPVSDPITPFQHQMLAKGYSRDHLTHRWYPAWESYTNNGCAVYGSPLNATFICRTPLSDGIADEK